MVVTYHPAGAAGWEQRRVCGTREEAVAWIKSEAPYHCREYQFFIFARENEPVAIGKL